MAILFDNSQLARGYWAFFRRLLSLLALMFGTYLLASICASNLIWARYRTTALCKDQEPWVFQEMMQPAEELLTGFISFVAWLCCYVYIYYDITRPVAPAKLVAPAAAPAPVVAPAPATAVAPAPAVAAPAPADNMNKESENNNSVLITKAASDFSIPQFDFAALSIDFTTEPKSPSAVNNTTILKTPRSHFIDEEPTTLNRKRPIPRLDSNSPSFSSWLGIDPTLEDDFMASHTMSDQTYKSGTMKDQSDVPSPERPSSASQIRSSHLFSQQPSDEDKQLLQSSWPQRKPSMSPSTNAESLGSTTPSDRLPRRQLKAPRDLTSRKRSLNHFGQKGLSKIPRLQLHRSNTTPPSSPSSDAGILHRQRLRRHATITHREQSRKIAASPIASKLGGLSQLDLANLLEGTS